MKNTQVLTIAGVAGTGALFWWLAHRGQSSEKYPPTFAGVDYLIQDNKLISINCAVWNYNEVDIRIDLKLMWQVWEHALPNMYEPEEITAGRQSVTIAPGENYFYIVWKPEGIVDMSLPPDTTNYFWIEDKFGHKSDQIEYTV